MSSSTWLYVLFGGCIGAPLRFWMGRVVARVWKRPFPLGTFLINLLGSFFLGALHAATQGAGGLWYFFGTGVLGAYTTFSTFGVEVVTLLTEKKRVLAVSYIFASAILGVLAAWLGAALFS